MGTSMQMRSAHHRDPPFAFAQPKQFDGRIEFKDVVFAYPTGSLAWQVCSRPIL